MRVFTVYTMSGCKWCVRVKNLLTSLGFSYVEKNIDENQEYLMQANNMAFKSIPQVFEGDRHIGGFEDTRDFLLNTTRSK